MTRHLTDKQKLVLEFIERHVSQTGSFPTYSRICEYFEWPSHNSATQYFKALKKKGYLWHHRDKGYMLRKQVLCTHCGQKITPGKAA